MQDLIPAVPAESSVCQRGCSADLGNPASHFCSDWKVCFNMKSASFSIPRNGGDAQSHMLASSFRAVDQPTQVVAARCIMAKLIRRQFDDAF